MNNESHHGSFPSVRFQQSLKGTKIWKMLSTSTLIHLPTLSGCVVSKFVVLLKNCNPFFCPWPKERNRRGPGPVSDSHSLNASTFTVAFGSSVRQAAFGINCGRDRSVQYSGKMNWWLGCWVFFFFSKCLVNQLWINTQNWFIDKYIDHLNQFT